MTAKSLLSNLLLGGIATLIALLGAELGLRLYQQRHAPPEPLDEALERSRTSELGQALDTDSLRGLIQRSKWPDVVFELKPGLHGTFKGTSLKINSHGLRGPDVELDKPQNTFRIVGLGDSVMFGWGVDQGNEYLRRLERKLDRATPLRVEVLNFAVPAYNTATEVATFERKALLFDPDLVILHMMYNDTRLPRFMASRPPLFSLRYSALSSLMQKAVGTLRAPDETLTGESSVEQATARHYAYMVGRQGVRNALARLDHLCRRRNIPVLIVMLPDQHRPADLAYEAQKDHGFTVIDPRQTFFAYLSEKNLLPEEFGATFWLSRKDHHPNSLAHGLYARSLAETILRSGLLPSVREGD